MARDFDSASSLLEKRGEASATLGRQYPAAERFLVGLRAMSLHKSENAIAALKDSYRIEPNPETAYYLAQAQMSASQWREAAETLEELLQSKGAILMDSVASLILLAEYDLAKCYEQFGKHGQAESLREMVKGLWEHADPELRGAVNR